MSAMTGDSFMTALTTAVHGEMQKLVEQEAEAAANRVRQRAKELGPELAMRLLKNFELTRDRNEIVIRFQTVEKA